MKEYEFMVTAVRRNTYGEMVDIRCILTTIKTKYKRDTSKKYAIANVLSDLNKDCGQLQINHFIYYSIV